MTKRYCDRCGRELVRPLDVYTVSYGRGDPRWHEFKAELCVDCFEAVKAVMEKEGTK